MEVETVLELWACIYRSLGKASCGTAIGLVQDAQAFLIWSIVYSCCCNIANLVIHSLYIKMFIAMSIRDLWNVGGWDFSQTVDTAHVNYLQRMQRVSKGTCPLLHAVPASHLGELVATYFPINIPSMTRKDRWNLYAFMEAREVSEKRFLLGCWPIV